MSDKFTGELKDVFSDEEYSFMAVFPVNLSAMEVTNLYHKPGVLNKLRRFVKRLFWKIRPQPPKIDFWKLGD